MNTIDIVPEPAEGQDAPPVSVSPAGPVIENVPAPLIEPPPPPNPPQPTLQHHRPRLPMAIAVTGIGTLLGLALWKRLTFDQTTDYLPVVLPSLIAGNQILFKDWDNYKPSGFRWFMLALVAAACFWGINYQTRQIGLAAARAETARQAQKDNTEVFTKQFSALSGELSDLKTKVTTEALQNKIVTLQDKLDKAIDPPKAAPLFTFVPYKTIRVSPTLTEGRPVTETTLTPSPDGSVHVEFTVMNLSEVDAMEGDLIFQICDACKFAKEPPEFMKLPGQTDHQRIKLLERFLAGSVLSVFSADIIPPVNERTFQVGVYIRCRTCIRAKEPQRATVTIAGRVP